MTLNREELELGQQDLAARLSLIETMIAEGRQTTESWGWSFVLWGVAYYIAIAWSNWGNGNYAWPVTMIAASILTAFFGTRQNRREPETTMGRAIGAIWIAMGSSLFILLFSASLSLHIEQKLFVAIVGAMLGSANLASSIILKWGTQFACALVWWAAAVVSCFANVTQSSIAFLVAIFLGQIVFGIYMMLSEARERKQNLQKSKPAGRGTAHA